MRWIRGSSDDHVPRLLQPGDSDGSVECRSLCSVAARSSASRCLVSAILDHEKPAEVVVAAGCGNHVGLVAAFRFESVNVQQATVYKNRLTPYSDAALKNDKWVVYSTFDAGGNPASYAVEQLQGYRDAGFDTIVVDSSPVLSEKRIDDWNRSSTVWLQRANIGYDFGSYKRGVDVLSDILSIPTTHLTLLLTNDSCYGPYVPMKDIFAHFDHLQDAGSHVFGITDSLQWHHHLQSYWLYFRSDVSHLAIEFLNDMPYIADRSDAVHHGELRLSPFLTERGAKLLALCPHEAVVTYFGHIRHPLVLAVELTLRRLLNRPLYSRNGDAACIRKFIGMVYQVNSTAAFGTHMHFMGFTPFIKRQLLRENPNADPLVPQIADIRSLDNAEVARLLRSTSRFIRRYGKNYQRPSSWRSLTS